MIYGILPGNKVHLSKIVRSLKEDITLKKAIDRLSRNHHSFTEKHSLMHNYFVPVKQHVKEDYAVIIMDNSDIAKPMSRKQEALSEILDGSTGEITQGFLTIEVTVYRFGPEPMLLLSNLKNQEKKRLCRIVAKVYLLRWRIEEYFRFKKQQFELEDLRVMSLQPIRSLNLLTMLAAGYIGLTSSVHKESIFLKELKECSKRIYEARHSIFIPWNMQ